MALGELDHEFRRMKQFARVEAQNKGNNHPTANRPRWGCAPGKSMFLRFSTQHGPDVLWITHRSAQNLDPSQHVASPDSPSTRLRQDLPPLRLVATLQGNNSSSAVNSLATPTASASTSLCSPLAMLCVVNFAPTRLPTNNTTAVHRKNSRTAGFPPSVEVRATHSTSSLSRNQVVCSDAVH